MPPKTKSKLTIKEIALRKSASAQARLEKIKSNPDLLTAYKKKERQKYDPSSAEKNSRKVKEVFIRSQKEAKVPAKSKIEQITDPSQSTELKRCLLDSEKFTKEIPANKLLHNRLLIILSITSILGCATQIYQSANSYSSKTLPYAKFDNRENMSVKLESWKGNNHRRKNEKRTLCD
nr:unnamed protein product [Callosobruchus analis]